MRALYLADGRVPPLPAVKMKYLLSENQFDRRNPPPKPPQLAHFMMRMQYMRALKTQCTALCTIPTDNCPS